jgi:3-methyladenine DNA glycosylase/8-oxoguanine DNA glycosylase
MRLSLPARKPFKFISVVNSHGWMQLAPFSFDPETETLSYILHFANGRVEELRIREAPGGVVVEVKGRLSQAERTEVAEVITWMLGLDMDFSNFYAASRGEPKLAQSRKLARGRVLRSPTLFEDVVKTILTTNTLWGATKRMNLNLINRFGTSLDGLPDKRAFPRPDSIAAASEKSLREKVRVGYRAPAIRELARNVASGAFDLESLKTSTLPTLDLRKELMKMNGVGPYAAANLLLILGRPDFIPIDSWALKLVSHEWYDGQPVTAKEVERAFEKWGEFKGLAFWFWDWKYNGS